MFIVQESLENFLNLPAMIPRTPTREDYLKALLLLTRKEGARRIPLRALAEHLGVSHSSILELSRALQEAGYVEYVPRQGVALTSEGFHHAIQVLRKHRLWEYFLVHTLQIPWEEVHHIAEQLEHIQSEVLIDRLEEFLGFPRYDPHGNPIPSRDGTFPPQRGFPLSEVREPGQFVIVSVSRGPASLLQWMREHAFMPGQVFRVHEILRDEENSPQYFVLESLACPPGRQSSKVVLPESLARHIRVVHQDQC